MPDLLTILTGLGLASLAGDAVKNAAQAGASKAGGFVLKSAYNRLAARFAGYKLPPDDPLTIAVVKAQTEVLLGFVNECKSTLAGLDAAATRPEHDWLDRKRRELESLRQNAERGAINRQTVQADDLRAILLDNGEPNGQLISAALAEITQDQPSDATDCFVGRVRLHFVERFMDVFRAKASNSDKLHRLVTETLLADLPAIRATAEEQLIETQKAGDQRKTLIAEFRGIRELLEQTGPLPTTQPSPRQINTLLPPPADFTGRTAELASLRVYIQRTQRVIITIRGRGGVGKSALTLQLAQELATQIPGPALYLDILGSTDSPISPHDAQIRILRVLSPNVEIPDDDGELAQVYRSTLAHQSGMVILDDARDFSQISGLLPPSRWALLVTSRRWFHIDGQFSVNLSEFVPDDAHALLLRATSSDQDRRRLSNEQADRIAKLCGYLPLALRLAVSALQNRPALTADDYIMRLEGPAGPLRVLDSEANASPGVRGLTATILASVSLLPEVQQKRWTTLGVFPADFEGYGVAAVWAMLSKDMDKDAALAARDAAVDCIDELVRFSLVDTAPSQGRYRLHLLLRSAALQELPAEDRHTTDERFAEFYSWIFGEGDRRLGDREHGLPSALSLLDAESTNIMAGWAWAISRAKDAETAARLAIFYASAGAHILPFRMRSVDRIEWYEASLDVARYIDDQPSIADFLTILGCTYADLGDLDQAISRHIESMRVAAEIPDTTLEMNAAGNLANTLARRGGLRQDINDIQNALDFHQHVLTNARLRGSERDEARTLMNMGQTYMQVDACYQALPLFERSLSLARLIEDRITEIRSLNSLGTLYRTLSTSGEYNDTLAVALDYLSQSMASATDLGDDRAIMVARGNIANVLHDAKRHAEAVQVNLEIVAALDSSTDPPTRAQALRNLALAHAAAGQFASAIAAAEAALPTLDVMDDVRAQILRESIETWRTELGREGSMTAKATTDS